MHREVRMFWSGVMLLMLFSSASYAEVVERRKDQYGRDFGYYAYPIIGEIPGMGRAAGFGVSVLNMADGDTDLPATTCAATSRPPGAALLDYNVVPRRVLFDVGYNDYLVAATAYNRGIDSDPLDVIYPRWKALICWGR